MEDDKVINQYLRLSKENNLTLEKEQKTNFVNSINEDLKCNRGVSKKIRDLQIKLYETGNFPPPIYCQEK